MSWFCSTKKTRKISALLLAAASVFLPIFAAHAQMDEKALPAARALQLAVSDAAATGEVTHLAPDATAESVAAEDAIDWSDVDADGDGVVTAADAALLLRFGAGLVSALPMSTGTNAQLTLNDAFSAAEKMMRNALNVDLSAYEARFAKKDLRRYSSYGQYANVFMDMADALSVTAQSAARECMLLLSRDFRSMSVALYPMDLSGLDTFNWKAVASLYYAFGKELPQKLSESINISFRAMPGNGQSLCVEFCPSEAVAALGNEDQLMHAKLAYAYLQTTVDDTGAPVLTQKHTYPEGYLEKIIHPLPGCLIKNCWFDPRDSGTRLHVGADIRANAKTNILSVTDGVVTQVGTMAVPGNYVVIMDPYGYEYHYYHMYEVSKQVQVGDKVKVGDVIGLVGNTGNSAANHLHLGIISPQQAYVNPYDLFVQAGIGPIRQQ